MEITRALLEAKLKEYEAARDEHLLIAKANEGAVYAIMDLIAALEEKEATDGG